METPRQYPPTKTCSRCRKDLPRAEFYKNKGRPDGIQTVCKGCTGKNNAKWRAANPDAHLRHYAEREVPAEESVARRVRWHAWRARQYGAFVEDVHPLVLLERDDGVCGICGDDVDPFCFDIDHVVPISRGGEHSYANTQVAHRSCNSSKKASMPGLAA